MAASEAVLPQIALIGAGIFARTTYIKNLRQITDRVTLKAIWDLTEVLICISLNFGFSRIVLGFCCFDMGLLICGLKVAAFCCVFHIGSIKSSCGACS